MRHHPRTQRHLLTLLLLATMGLGWAMPAFGDSEAEFTKAYHAHGDGNHAEAYDGLRSWLLSDDSFNDTQSLRRAEIALDAATECLQHLNRVKETDEFLEAVVAKHPGHWQVLQAVANSYGPYGKMIHYGHMIAGDFERGQHRGGGQYANAFPRDRVRALQLYRQAYAIAQEADVADTGDLLTRLAQALRSTNSGNQAWRLQTLTDLETLPDYDDGPAHWGSGGAQGAPVDEEGNPIVYEVPASWEAATNDGERWRWALEEFGKINDAHQRQTINTRADFLQEQFGVQTLASYGHWFRRPTAGDTDTDAEKRKGIWALNTLDDSETIAQLATGIKRVTLLDEHNHLKLYLQLLELQRKSGRVSSTTAMQIAHIYLNRQQYPKAVRQIQLAIEHADKNQRKRFQQQLDQIVKNWGRFDSTLTQPAGRGAEVDFVFRNANNVEFTAHAIDIPKLLSDVKAYFKSNPQDSDRQPMSLEQVGHHLIRGKQEKYAKKEVARWSLDLEPLDNHFDCRITVTTPLQKAGAYLLTATLPEGNTIRIVVWLADTTIVRKPMADRTLYYVADAVTGAPIEKANIEFFGYHMEELPRKKREAYRYTILTEQFAEYTNAAGQAFLNSIRGDNEKSKFRHKRMKWIAVATTPDGRLAYHGFQRIWTNDSHDAEYKATKVFTVTDRPVYRPEQTVQFKFWVRHAKYDLEDASQFAYKSFQVEIQNPRGEKVYSETLAADEYGGIEGEFLLPEDATLGQYRLNVVKHGGGSFRVEEYKKPEFEVTVDAPTEPVALGEKITATISAKYYFGSPVTQATVKYKVLRTEHNGTWYPPSQWDWLYGPGYWWFGYDYDWLPGWHRWGCLRPSPWWFWRGNSPPEVVAEREVEIGPDGTVEVEIDTSLAKLLHPDQDHSYQVQAEVVDQSRRTIVGNGRVLVAREPFKVFAWVDRGHYRVGDTVMASFAARRLDGKAVEGTGKLKLLKLSYADADSTEPTETEVRQWDLAPGTDGKAEMKINASEKGVYRLSYTVTDGAQHTIEGGYVFTIAGEGYDGRDYQFNDLEIVPDQRDYAPGDKVQLRVNTNRIGSTVLLFVRPANGVYAAPPQVLRLDGKSTLVEVDVLQKDMPNFYVEAVTIADGRIHTQVREIHVPPAKRVLNVEVVPSASEYQPGQEATVKLKLTDESGKPFVGSTVLAIYDKSVEYISGGSNVGDIKEFFWKWRRQHQSQTRSNLDRRFNNLVKDNETSMGPLGIFGHEDVGRGLMYGRGVYSGRMRRGPSLLKTDQGYMWLQAVSSMAVPMAASSSLDDRNFSMRERNPVYFDTSAVEKSEEESDSAELTQPTVRQEFADTALWVGSLKTDDNGLASAELTMPENLTTWKVRVWGMGHGTRVGEGTAEIVTRKNLIVRMQAPRFFVERDEVVLSANVHNYLPDAKQVTVRLELDGKVLEAPSVLEETIEIEAGGEQRVNWTVKVLHEGEAVVRMLALTDQESDAVQQKFPAYVHGIEKMDSFSGSLANDETLGAFEIDVPSERRVEDTRLEVRYSPTLAGAMVDALPYLIDYPYGCTEQTLNRFLPAVITQQTLIRMGVDLEALQEKSTNLNAQEVGNVNERAEQWKRFDREPVFDPAELDKIVKSGVQRLTEMQLTDGGWGWFSGWGERSSPHTTATVVRGLLVAQKNDVALVPGMLDRGITWLENYQAQQIKRLKNVAKDGTVIDDTRPHKHQAGNLDALVYMVLSEADKKNDTMRDFLYRDRTSLAVYSMAMFGVALHNQDETDKLAMILRNLSQYVVQDDENQTAYLNLPGSYWWHWYGSEYEAHAYYLKLLAATNPKSAVAPRLVKYLLNNRRHSTYWNSTRDTALVVEAMADYLEATGEAQPDLTVEVWLDGEKRKEVAITAENLFSFDNKFVLTGSDLEAGRHTVELRKIGKGPLYYNGYLTNFTLEDDIHRAGLELKVNRRYYKLVPVDEEIDVAGGRGQVVSQRIEKYDREAITNLGEVKSGDLVEIELVVESKNDYEYIILEDRKAAGFEPVEVQSGYNGNAMGAYIEYRDERVSLFLRQLARGTHSVSYRMRAEIPGRFSALPTKAYAMYAPELKGNSDEIKIRVVE